jgi:hypothetical protein
MIRDSIAYERGQEIAYAEADYIAKRIWSIVEKHIGQDAYCLDLMSHMTDDMIYNRSPIRQLSFAKLSGYPDQIACGIRGFHISTDFFLCLEVHNDVTRDVLHDLQVFAAEDDFETV